MNVNDYQVAALRTEAVIDDERIARLGPWIRKIKISLSVLIELGRQLDVIKRNVYYKKDDIKGFDGEDESYFIDEIARMRALTRPMHGLIGQLSELGELAEAFYKHI